MELADTAAVLDRYAELRRINQTAQADRERIRMIMNGGTQGIRAIMAWDLGKGTSGRKLTDNDVADIYGVDLPTVNWFDSGLTRLAQRVGKPPTLKAPPAENDEMRSRLERRMRIVRGWDWQQRFELQFPQVGRWLPGYGNVMWKITQSRYEGVPFPKAALRDPYDIYPGWFGADQQPEEVATVRKVPLKILKDTYPDLDWNRIERDLMDKRGVTRSGGVILSGVDRWEGPQTGIEVVEYMCSQGSHIVVPEVELSLTVIPSIIDEATFVISRRYSFDRNLSQYHHLVGLMAMQAKLNIMGIIASEDSVFRELNIFGELISNGYERGRFAINEFDRDARVERPTADIPQMMWQQVDRLEEALRIGANYDRSQDGLSPQSFATGASVDRLQGAVNNNVTEYHLGIRHGVEQVDYKRLKWADKAWNAQRVKIFDMAGSNRSYRPSRDINGGYGSRRIYGAMAGWDDTVKAAVGLQYLGAGVFSPEVVQENVDGLEDVDLVNNQIMSFQARTALIQRLGGGDPNDPRGNAALVELMLNPQDREATLKKYFTPEEVEGQQEELEALQALQTQAVPPEMTEVGPRPPASTVLSQVELGGGVRGGVQTAGRIGPNG